MEKMKAEAAKPDEELAQEEKAKSVEVTNGPVPVSWLPLLCLFPISLFFSR
ncbi:unnamed protein product [Dibothriocephalus latus]|uniref:Uncharacterized protein n=1 Tax=Dibothriocephalus latus TaxID=60516 RepID=A0A3P7NXX6_DIBLA|nr:unnamed protein product [Dibothriocephalus latus]